MMAHHTQLETSFEELRTRLVYTLHSQAFDWVRMDSLFFWCKNVSGKPSSGLCRDDFETYYYWGEGGKERPPSFCDRVYRAATEADIPTWDRPCEVSTFQAVLDVMRGEEFSIYTCHAGITDMALPLFDDGEPVGVWVMGQVLRHPASEEHFSAVTRKRDKLTAKMNLPELRKAYYALPVVQESELRQLLNTLTLAWENMLEHRKRTLLHERLEPHIKRELVRDMLAGRIGSVESIVEKAGMLQLRGIPTTAVVVELGGIAQTQIESDLTARAASIVEDAMSRFESSVTAPLFPGRIVTLVAARTVRNEAHFRLLLREATEQACQRIQTELGLAVTGGGVGTVRERIGETRQSYEDAVAQISSGAAAGWHTGVNAKQARGELMQLAAELVAQLTTATSEEFERLFHRICALGARVADEDMPWVAGFSSYLIGRLAEGLSSRPVVKEPRVQQIAASAISCISRVADPLAWEKCFNEALQGFRDVSVPNAGASRDALRAKKAMAFIDANCNRKVTVQEIGAHICISKSRLKSIFKQQTGVTCAEYLSQRRIELARTLLAGGQGSIGEIAARLGFSCPNSFSRWFRRVTGDSPRQFRRDLSCRSHVMDR
jgi:AraC-like DNA-binding protein/ligand-binding sensor protein